MGQLWREIAVRLRSTGCRQRVAMQRCRSRSSAARDRDQLRAHPDDSRLEGRHAGVARGIRTSAPGRSAPSRRSNAAGITGTGVGLCLLKTLLAQRMLYCGSATGGEACESLLLPSHESSAAALRSLCRSRVCPQHCRRAWGRMPRAVAVRAASTPTAPLPP